MMKGLFGIQKRRIWTILFYCAIVYAFLLFIGILGRHSPLKNVTKPSKFQKLARAWVNRSYVGPEEYIYYSTMRLGLKPLHNLHPVRPDFGPVVNDIASIGYRIEPVKRCTKETTILFAVVSAPKHILKRLAMRETWMKDLNRTKTLALFITGLPDEGERQVQRTIKAESVIYGDILQTDMIDSYYKLSEKLAALLYWVNENCPHVSFVVKCDDDIYVNVRNLNTLLRSIPADEPRMYGTSHALLEVMREPNTKWTISYEDWPWTSYPSYYSGGFSLMTGRSVAPLLAAAQVTPYFWVDDVYLSGILSRKAKVPLFASTSMMYEESPDFPDPCLVRRSISWITDSIKKMKISHAWTEDFFGTRQLLCVVPSENSDASDAVLDPIEDWMPFQRLE